MKTDGQCVVEQSAAHVIHHSGRGQAVQLRHTAWSLLTVCINESICFNAHQDFY